jgi:integrase
MPIYKMPGKRDGRQKYRVRVNYTDALGAARQLDRVAYGSDEAKMLEMRLLRDIKEEAPARAIRLQELFDEYVAAKKYDVRETSLDKASRILEYHVLPILRDTRLDKLTMPALQSWKLGIENKNLSIKMRQNIYSSFRALLNYAVKMEYIQKNPLLRLGNFSDTLTPAKEMKYYTAEEWLKYKSAALGAAQRAEARGDMREWHYYVFFCAAFYTGLRKGEIHALRWTDIDGAVLRVTRSIAQKLKGGDRETPPKNKSSIRALQLPAPLLAVLEEHKTRCARVEGFAESNHICGGAAPLRDSSIQNHNAAYAQAAKLQQIRIHDFRHSHVSLLANNGINIQEIARRLGHSKIDETWNTYSHLYPREEERAVKILDEII